MKKIFLSMKPIVCFIVVPPIRIASRESYGPTGIESVRTSIPISELAKGEVDIYCLHAGYGKKPFLRIVRIILHFPGTP